MLKDVEVEIIDYDDEYSDKEYLEERYAEEGFKEIGFSIDHCERLTD